MDKTTQFIVDNYKSIVVVVSFMIGLYIQHVANTAEIEALHKENIEINQRLNMQYEKLDAMKLDKSVYEAQMKQIYDMSDDIREIRRSVENLMRDKK